MEQSQDNGHQGKERLRLCEENGTGKKGDFPLQKQEQQLCRLCSKYLISSTLKNAAAASKFLLLVSSLKCFPGDLYHWKILVAVSGKSSSRISLLKKFFLFGNFAKKSLGDFFAETHFIKKFVKQEKKVLKILFI